MLDSLQSALTTLRKTNPLVLNLTNVVTMDFMANAQLAIGASPLMSVADDELEELIKLSNAININIGTLDTLFIERCLKAAALAKQYQKPMVLDPVGAGASIIRTKTAQALLPYCTVLRGNASEILALANVTHATKGVDSAHSTQDAATAAKQLAKQHEITVVVSGAIDYLTNGNDEITVPYGSALMPRIVGMGCTLTGVIAAFIGSHPHAFDSAYAATLCFGLAGSAAEKKASAPASFQIAFIDALFATPLHEWQALC